MIENISASILKFCRKNYIKTLIIIFIIMLIINLLLIGCGHFDDSDDESDNNSDDNSKDNKKIIKRNAGNTLTDGFYFTTTQFSTVGYGDITPKTTIAKWISGFFHITIVAISLSLLSEIGIMNKPFRDIETSTIISENSPTGLKLEQYISDQQPYNNHKYFHLDENDKIIDNNNIEISTLNFVT